jgi:hypothetical protein
MGVVETGGFAQNPGYYFGDIQQRLSLALYKKIITRHFFNDVNAVNGGWLYYITAIGLALLIAAFAYSAAVSRFALTYYIPCGLAIILPWLVFPNLYSKHNYYQLPGQILLIGAMGIAFSIVIDRLFSQKANWSSWIHSPRSLIILIAIAGLIPRVNVHSDLSNKSEWKAAQFLFRDTNDPVNLYGSPDTANATIGGLISSPIRHSAVNQLKLVCQQNSVDDLPDNGIVLKSTADTEKCRTWIKEVSKSFVDEKTFWMWIK